MGDIPTKLVAATLFAMVGFTARGEVLEDPLLGEGFSVEALDMGCDYSGEVGATLIRALPIVEGRDAVVYIHGYNDYFFQSDMAHRFLGWGYNFYAVDLRKFGRSLRAGQTPFEVRDLREYFAEIDIAVSTARSEGAERVVVMGHSTGGLIASYYAGCSQNDLRIDGLILNSPFFSQNVGWMLESVVMPIVSFAGRFVPNVEVYQDGSSLYFESLHKTERGEWSYDPRLKMRVSPPITAGWIRAIDKAQRSVQSGYSLKIPILLLYSNRSVSATEWSDDLQRGDAVLDVEEIARYGSRLGENVTHEQIEDGMHDLILSRPDVREKVYSVIGRWLALTKKQKRVE